LAAVIQLPLLEGKNLNEGDKVPERSGIGEEFDKPEGEKV
jgi:hypothetical protein